MDSGVDLDGEIRRVDPDRWLASRFIADRARRAAAIALYAFDHELTRAEAATSNPLAAEIRLVWWREAVAEIFAGEAARRHPVAEAVARAIRERNPPEAPFREIFTARLAILGRQSLTEAEAVAWADGAQGSLATLVAHCLGAGAEAEGARAAGTAWGLAMIGRTRRAPSFESALREAMRRAALEARRLPARAFPAALPATLGRAELAGRSSSELDKRWRLAWASLTGRL